MTQSSHDLVRIMHAFDKGQHLLVLAHAVWSLMASSAHHQIIGRDGKLFKRDRRERRFIQGNRHSILTDDWLASFGGNIDLVAFSEEPVVGIDDIVVLKSRTGEDNGSRHVRSLFLS